MALGSVSTKSSSHSGQSKRVPGKSLERQMLHISLAKTAASRICTFSVIPLLTFTERSLPHYITTSVVCIAEKEELLSLTDRTVMYICMPLV